MTRNSAGFSRFFKTWTIPTTGSWPSVCTSRANALNAPILVTKDLNMQLKALAIGLEAQDYENDKVEVSRCGGLWSPDTARLIRTRSSVSQVPAS